MTRTHRFQNDERSDTIVESSTDHQSVEEIFGSAVVQDSRIADSNHFLGVLFVISTDVDPEIFIRGDLLPILLFLEMNRRSPDDPQNHARLGQDTNALAGEDL
ncbi:MAG: hypothetical protein NTY11_01030, partial [Candidatus Parcubacteria bacterium]|nr:hypothetical protein [Candidatus Parcubacteria bacterium]